MNVFSKIGGFLNRHRNKFFVGGVVITGSILLTRYAQQRLREWQQNEAKEFFERTRKQQHFESTERTCNQTILNLVAALNESLAKTINTDGIIAELRNNPDNKVELWDRLKVLVFSKVSCLVYISALLVSMLRVQMNVVGGYLYKDPACVTLEMQQKYLSLCHSLLDSGVQKLSKLLQDEYSKILEILPLKRQLKIDDLEKIFWAIQMAIRENELDPIKNFKQLVIADNTPNEKDVYSCMVQDTADLLDSEEVKILASSCISRGFVVLSDQISEYYGPSASSSTEGAFVHPSDVKIPLAKLIPIINGLVSKNSLPDVLIQQLIVNDKLKTLGANVYEAFSYNNNNL